MPKSSTPFNVVYHITTINHWQAILSEQLTALFTNRNLKSLHVTIAATSNANLTAVQNLLATAVMSSHPELPVSGNICRPDQFEHPAMDILDQLARADDAPVLYFHMKGVSSSPPSPLWETWRRYLNQFISQADHWAEFLSTSTYDACGPLQLFDQNHGFTYFAGNFWMAKATYLRQLPAYLEFAQNPGSPLFAPYSRYLAEIAVDRTKNMKPYSTDGTSLTPQTIWPLLKSLRI